MQIFIDRSIRPKCDNRLFVWFIDFTCFVNKLFSDSFGNVGWALIILILLLKLQIFFYKTKQLKKKVGTPWSHLNSRYLNPIPTRVGRFCPTYYAQSHLNFPLHKCNPLNEQTLCNFLYNSQTISCHFLVWFTIRTLWPSIAYQKWKNATVNLIPLKDSQRLVICVQHGLRTPRE